MTKRMAATMAALLAAATATAAMAHSPVETTDPADGAVLAAGPEVIRIEFADPVRLVGVALSGDGTEADLDIPSDGDAIYELEAPEIPAGSYRVEWRGMAEDGHVMTGTFSFEVE